MAGTFTVMVPVAPVVQLISVAVAVALSEEVLFIVMVSEKVTVEAVSLQDA